MVENRKWIGKKGNGERGTRSRVVVRRRGVDKPVAPAPTRPGAEVREVRNGERGGSRRAGEEVPSGRLPPGRAGPPDETKFRYGVPPLRRALTSP
jgi:hypothetical protein